MSEFKTGVRQLHAISTDGRSNTHFASSAVLQSEAQVAAWLDSESKKHQLPPNMNWYAIDDTEVRFVKTPHQTPPATAPTASPNVTVEPVAPTANVEASTPEAKEACKNKYNMASTTDNRKVMAYERKMWNKRNEARIKKNEAFAKHMNDFKG